MFTESDSEQHSEIATVSGQFSGIILFLFIPNKSKCCLQTNDDFIHLLWKYFYYGFVMAIMHEYENDKYFLAWVHSLWRNSVLLWFNNLFAVRDVFVVDLTVFHSKLVFFYCSFHSMKHYFIIIIFITRNFPWILFFSTCLC